MVHAFAKWEPSCKNARQQVSRLSGFVVSYKSVVRAVIESGRNSYTILIVTVWHSLFSSSYSNLDLSTVTRDSQAASKSSLPSLKKAKQHSSIDCSVKDSTLVYLTTLMASGRVKSILVMVLVLQLLLTGSYTSWDETKSAISSMQAALKLLSPSANL